ncbi:type II toxin-antitoxin system RatA family toxin [Amycolatopsis sp. GM8]|uniref:type II toxin-antitoxin system RatA family toxin n=1 Tax=Amycolatopsis sp. GM8 TaxID=2896530 RepID=UPI001F289651|nr:SRPBCC family protein [Amycolatopsis sp. GM8]
MRSVRLEALVPQGNAAVLFERISDFPRYADYTDAVREVSIDRTDGDLVTSTWSVNFRNGILRWRERDQIDADALHIVFEQIDGDFERFDGSWRVTQTGEDATVVFVAEFDLGMPSLAAIIDPIAERALREHTQAVLRGLLGEHIIFPGPDRQPQEIPS